MPLILFNKPFRVMSQFSPVEGKATLADWIPVRDVYPAGRLDFDSEGLLLLTDDGRLQARISQPRSKTVKVYRAQVEGAPEPAQLAKLEAGVHLKDGTARARFVRQIDEPADLWPRDPPVRYRKSVPDTWLELGLTEGRNRIVRRMTAAVGLPTLRLIRCRVGPWDIEGLPPGEWREIGNAEAWKALTT